MDEGGTDLRDLYARANSYRLYIGFLRIRPNFLRTGSAYRPSSVRASPCQLPQGGSFFYAILPYMVNMGRYTPSSKNTVMTARPMVMQGSMMERRRSVARETSLLK